MGLFGGKSYKTSEELALDACYPKKLPDCLKFVQKTLKKGAPYPGDFTHEKLVVLEFNYLLKTKNTQDVALGYVELLTENVMPYVIKSLEKTRADDYLHHLPTAYMETLYDNLSAMDIVVDAEKSAVAFVLAYFYFKNKTFGIIKSSKNSLKKWHGLLTQAKGYSDNHAVSLMEKNIDNGIKQIEALL